MAKSVDEDVPVKEPQVYAADADMQKALEASLKSMYDVPRCPLPPVVIREPESRKNQSLPEVAGKGKAKVTKEQVAHDLLSLQKPKKKSPTDQYILQRRTSTPTGSSRDDESLYVELGHCADVTGVETDGLGGALGAVDLVFRAGLVGFGAGESGSLPVSPAGYRRCLATFAKYS
uniref:Uncharacterized protein n=1 Tax=Tanacetum cinerariifolium TaxID=118510 RepID=A0A699S807_TANCI|nr:hypothetical protein [Tanacetum cinerariifolium]